MSDTVVVVVAGLWKVPRPEEEGEASSRSGLSKGGQFADERLDHVEPTSLWRTGLPGPERGALSGETETLRPVRRTFGEDGPHLQVEILSSDPISLVEFTTLAEKSHLISRWDGMEYWFPRFACKEGRLFLSWHLKGITQPICSFIPCWKEENLSFLLIALLFLLSRY